MGLSEGADSVGSPFETVLRVFPRCEVRRYSKRTLIALSHGMEDLALAREERGKAFQPELVDALLALADGGEV